MLCEIFALCTIGIENLCLFRGVPNGIFQQNTLFLGVKLDKESTPFFHILKKVLGRHGSRLMCSVRLSQHLLYVL